MASDVLSALEENGYGETTETIEGETFNDIEEAISYIQDVVLAELEEFKDKRKKTFLFINKFRGSI